MAIINYTDQIKYAGKGYLDAKMMPVNTVNDLKAIPLTQRFEGLTITVLNGGKPQDYWLVGGITNNNWIPKTSAGDFSDLKLVLEDGFLKLMNGDSQMGEPVDFNDFFPESSEKLCIVEVDYVTTNDKGATGVFMCFTYSDNTKKYLDMAQFLSQVYTGENGIVINGNVISLDSAIVGRIETLEVTVAGQEEVLSDLKKRLSTLSDNLNSTNARVDALEKRVDNIVVSAGGPSPDEKTLTVNPDDDTLSVKILQDKHNFIKVDENGGGLFTAIPIYLEDEELM